MVRALAGTRVLTKSDGIVVDLLAETLAEISRARAVLVSEGPSYSTRTESGSTLWRARPEQSLLADAQRRAMPLLACLGLSPEWRAKVAEVAPPGPGAGKWSGLLPASPRSGKADA